MSAKTVLIVEDDLVSSKVAAYKLKAAGYEVLTAGDGEEAVKLARERKPDLALLDLGLPNQGSTDAAGWDGFKVLGWLQRLYHDAPIPIIIVSARDAEENRAKALAAGAVDYLQKPVKNEQLLAAVRAALDKPTSPAS